MIIVLKSGASDADVADVERRIRAIRLFQDPSGWTPHYTESGVDAGFQPVCFGPSYVPTGSVAGS